MLDSSAIGERIVILVDDDPFVLRALRRELVCALAPQGVTVLTASSGGDCLAILEERRGSVSLVVSDLRMPRMGGAELVMRVRDSYPDVALMLLTAYADANEIEPRVAAIIQACLLKPWDHDRLVSHIQEAVCASHEAGAC